MLNPVNSENFNIHDLIAAARVRAEQAEAFYVEEEETPIEFKFNSLYAINTIQTKGVGLRVIKDGRIGFSSTTDLSKLTGLLDDALTSARYGQFARFSLPGQTTQAQVALFDKTVDEIKNETCVEIGLRAIEAIRRVHPDVICETDLSRARLRVQLINSQGLDMQYEKTIFGFSITTLLQEKEGGFQWLHEGHSSCRFFTNIDEYTNNLNDMITKARTLLPFSSQKWPVLFMPQAVPALLGACKIALSGKNLQKGISSLAGKTGNQIFDPRLSISDEPQLAYQPASRPFDGEGTPTHKTVLIEKGILKNFIFDLQTAGILGCQTTGHGLRSYATQPAPGFTNFVVAKGNVPLTELIKGMKEGLVVYSCLGGGQSNLVAGDFSVNVGLGYKVENGEITGRIKNAMLSGNVYEEFLHNLEALSLEQKEFASMLIPAFSFKRMNIIAK